MIVASLLLLSACAPEEGAPLGDTAAPAAQDDGLHGRIERHGDRDVLYLWGTREEMGYAEGALYCDRVAPLFKDYLLEHLVGQYSDYTYDVARVYVLATTEFHDDDLRELEAMYQGMVDHCSAEELTVASEFLGPNVDERPLEYEDLLFANAVADFGCSSFTAWGAASSTGDTIHGRNFDWAVDSGGTFLEEHLIKVYDSEEEGARWLSVSVPALAGCITCVSEEGVGLTMHNVSGLDPTKTVDISPRMFAARAALAATYGADDVVAAAEAELEARPQLVGNNLHLSFPTARSADGIGAVVFEYDGAADHADGQVTVRWPGEDPDRARTLGIAATNHYVKRRAPEMDGDSYERQASLLAAVDAAEQDGGIALDRGHDMLSAVVNGYSGLTVHSILVDTASRELRLHVAADPQSPAPDAAPTVLDLDALFGALP